MKKLLVKRTIIILILLIFGVCFAGTLKTSVLTKIKNHIISESLTYEQLDSISIDDLGLTADESKYARRYAVGIGKLVKFEYMVRKRESLKPAIKTSLGTLRNQVMDQGFTKDQATRLILEVIEEVTNED